MALTNDDVTPCLSVHSSIANGLPTVSTEAHSKLFTITCVKLLIFDGKSTFYVSTLIELIKVVLGGGSVGRHKLDDLQRNCFSNLNLLDGGTGLMNGDNADESEMDNFPAEIPKT